MDKEPILGTVTGEYFQPVRLHYQVSGVERLLQALAKLHCVEPDPPRERWVWLYQHEARELVFRRSYADLPEQLRPVVLGSFFVRGTDKLLLDMRSIERATQAVPFFDKHLPRAAARVTEAEVVNKVYPVTGNSELTPHAIFDSQVSVARHPDAEVEKIKAVAAQYSEPTQRLDAALKYMHDQAKQRLPEIESFPVNFYSDGIDGFAMSLRLRQVVALQHWLGNQAYTLDDALQQILAS